MASIATAWAAKSTLDFIIDVLSGRAKDIIRTAAAEGRELEIEAGTQLLVLIDKLNAVFHEQRNKTLEEIDQTFRKELDFVTECFDAVIETNTPRMQKLRDEALTFLNASIAANHLPLVSRVTPLSASPSADDELEIVVSGSFPQAAKEGLKPWLTLNSYGGQLISNTQSELRFRVPVKALTFGDEKEIALFGSVIFPTKAVSIFTDPKGWFWSLFSPPVNYTYRFTMGALPSSPGKLHLSWLTQKNEPTDRWRSEEVVHRGGQKTYPMHATPGWKVVPNTAKGEVWKIDNGKHVKPNAPCHITTQLVGETTVNFTVAAGKMNVQFEKWFYERKLQQTVTCNQEELPLVWGQTQTIQAPTASDLKVRFIDFAGRETIASGTLNHRFFTVTTQADGFLVRVREPKDIR